MTERSHDPLPPTWQWSTLGAITTPSVAQGGPVAGVDFVYIDISSVDNKSKRITEPRILPVIEAPSRAKQRLVRDDVLVSMTRPNLNAVARVPRELDGAIGSTGFHVLRSVEVDPGWIAYAVQSSDFVETMTALVQGALYPAVRPHDIREYRVPVPPRAEQRRIVAALDEHLSDLDAAVSALQRARANTTSYQSALIARAVCGSAKASSDLADEYDLPSGWQWRGTSECCVKIDNGNTPSADKMYPEVGEVPFIKVYNLTHHGRLDFSVKPTFIDRATHEGSLRRSRLIPGDVLTNIVGPPLGKVAIVPDTFPEWNTNQAVVCFRAGPDLINRYLALVLRAGPIIKRLSSQARATAGQFNISLTMCRTLRIPVPPIQEQQRILAEVEHRLVLADRTSEEIDVQLARAKRLRQALLKRAFEGNLVPQNPDDEPASALLERIRNEPDTSDTRERRSRAARPRPPARRGRT